MFWCSVDGAAFFGCASPVILSGLVEGPHQFQMYVVDDAGNVSSTRGQAWSVDTTAPNPTITSGPDPITNDHSARFTFTADEGHTKFACSLDTGPTYPCTSGVQVVGLAQGGHVFVVYANDRAGNVGAGEWSWTIVLTRRPVR